MEILHATHFKNDSYINRGKILKLFRKKKQKQEILKVFLKMHLLYGLNFVLFHFFLFITFALVFCAVEARIYENLSLVDSIMHSMSSP